MGCPSGFEAGTQRTCHALCPPEFTYLQETCRFTSDPSKRISLNALPEESTDTQFATERSRVTTEDDAIRARATEVASLRDAHSRSAVWGQAHTTLQRQYTEFADVSNAMDSASARLKTKRPPTAPAEDLSRERQLILNGPGIDILLIQLALLLAVLSLLSFLLLSRPLAQGVTFVLLSTGVAVGFFLRK